jgi:uncharacterized protein (TIGR03000 family)
MLNRWNSPQSLLAVAMLALLLVPGTSAAQVRVGIGIGGRGFSPFFYYPGAFGYGLGGYPGVLGAWNYPGYGLGGYPSYYGGYSYWNSYTPQYASPMYYGTYYYRSAPSALMNTYTFTYSSRSGSARRSGDTTAHFEVRVPRSDAEVWFEGVKRPEQGTVRTFDSPSVTPGTRYVYRVRARWREDGREVERTKDVYFRAGDRVRVDFQDKQ